MHLLRRLDPSSSKTHGHQTYFARKTNWGTRSLNRRKSFSNDDLEELKACIELGFGFGTPDIDPKLCCSLPALESYHALHKQQFSKSLSIETVDAEIDKGRLKQWARLVACAVRESSSRR